MGPVHAIVISAFSPIGLYVFNFPYRLFFFNDTATAEIYTLSLHDVLPILCSRKEQVRTRGRLAARAQPAQPRTLVQRSEEPTSELQSLAYLVCRLLLQ